MRTVKSSNTNPEMVVRRMLHSAGFRYRLHRKDLPGKPDLVFRSRKKVILVHGCFWHQHEGCPHAARPESNTSYWEAKLDGNVVRDSGNLTKLTYMGWRALVVWECEIRNREALAARLTEFLAE